MKNVGREHGDAVHASNFITTPLAVAVQYDDVLPVPDLTSEDRTLLTYFAYLLTSPDSPGDVLLNLDAAVFEVMIWRDKKGYAGRMKLPYWPVAATTSILPLSYLYRHRKARRRTRQGLCPRCGYDLRATPERCPECGTPAPATPAAPPANVTSP